MSGYRDVMRAGHGLLWDVDPDGTCWVILDGDTEPVAGVPVGRIPPAGAQVHVAHCYDRMLVLGYDGRTTLDEPPVIPQISHDADNIIATDTIGFWKVPDQQQAAGGFLPLSGGVVTGNIAGPDAKNPSEYVTLQQLPPVVGFGGSAHIVADPSGEGFVDLPAGLLTAAPAAILVTSASEPGCSPFVYYTDPAKAPTASRFYVGGLKAGQWHRLAVWIVPQPGVTLLGSRPSTPSGGTPAVAVPTPAPTPAADVHLGAPTSMRTYDGTGAKGWDDGPAGKLYFGQYSSLRGMQRSAVAWDAAAMSAMRAVAADKVTGLTLRIHVDHTWANAGGTLRIGASGDTTVPATLPLPSGLAWDITVPHTGWVDVKVPLPIAKKFAAGGTLSGFHFYGARSDSYGYGYLARTAELFLHRTN